MKKNLSAAAALLFSAALYSQVGINNDSPKATLDIIAKTTDGSKPEGMIAPRLTGDQIKAADAQYGSGQKGTIIYATAAVSAASTKTVNMNSEGYYYFDGSLWQKMGNTAAAGSWGLNGNAGTDPAVNFIGTTSSGEHLVFKTAGSKSGLIMDAATGYMNTAFGSGALNLNANNYNSTYYNTAFGSGALGSNTGNNNTALGTYAASSVTNGNYNTAIGRGSFNVSTTGSNNVAFGYSSLSGNTTGDKNIGLGNSAASNITTGNNNIVIGTDQKTASATASNQLNIGGAIFGTGLSGTAGGPAGNIGIGTASPGSTLEVNGSATNTSAYNAGSSTTIDFSRSNLAYTSASAGNFTLQNMKDGGTYSLSVRGTTSGTSSFTATGFTFKYVNNNASITNTDTLYTFVAMGSIVYVYCVRGL